jgi:cytochrome oxidase Cu insertion factor (SCO1/SenC/PrrC family)
VVALVTLPLVAGVTAARHFATTTTPDPVPRDLYKGSEPPAGIRAPDFTLLDYRGRTVRMLSLRGRVVVTTFVDSACHEACPIIVGQLAQALRTLDAEQRKRVVALAITVNPKIDTPAHVRRFLRERRALGEVDYLIGPAKRMRAVWTAYAILPAVDTGDADTHSADVRIFNPDGIWVATQHVGADLTPAHLVYDISRALRDSR